MAENLEELLTDTRNFTIEDFNKHEDMYDSIIAQIARKYPVNLKTQNSFFVQVDGQEIEISWVQSLKQIVKLKILKRIDEYYPDVFDQDDIDVNNQDSKLEEKDENGNLDSNLNSANGSDTSGINTSSAYRKVKKSKQQTIDEEFTFPEMHRSNKNILETLSVYYDQYQVMPPFTLQRLCELLSHEIGTRSHPYSQKHKFLFNVEKLINVQWQNDPLITKPLQ
eukprot:403357078